MNSPQHTAEANLAQTVLKALDVLECLAEAERPLTAPQVARACRLSRPTAYRLLSTLASRGYLVNLEHEYTLSTRVLSLSRIVLNSLDLPRLAHPYLQELSAASEETCYLTILDGTEILYIDHVESSQSVRMHASIGARNPLHCSAMGKAILAYLPAEERDNMLEQITLTRRTENTITDKAQLLEELALICKRGFAIDDIENEEGVRCAGAPIFNHMGRVIGATSISGPAYRLPIARLETFGQMVMKTAASISNDMGHSSKKSDA